MELRSYYLGLSLAERKAFAIKAGTSVDYLRIHLIPAKGRPDRIPRKALFRQLAEATGGQVSLGEVATHFLGTELQINAA